jgi:hypothetical protein
MPYLRAAGPIPCPGAAAGNKARVEQLIAQGDDVNASIGAFSGTPLIEAASKGRKGVVKLLIARGGDVNGRGGFYEGTPLYYAAVCRRMTAVWGATAATRRGLDPATGGMGAYPRPCLIAGVSPCR